MSNEIPIFFASDDNYIPCLAVAIQSLIDNTSSDNIYKLIILQTDMSNSKINELLAFETDNIKIEIKDISSIISKLEKLLDLRLRDYYSSAIYYRMFISSLYPEYNINNNMIGKIVNSSSYYGIGNYILPKSILNKRGEYTPAEDDIIKVASTSGASIVKYVLTNNKDVDLQYCYEIAKYYSENYDGTGYPEGLKGEEIPIEARIMALADVFDALVSKRCYKDAFSYERAYEIIEKDAGTHFDNQLAMVFLSCKEELERYYNASEK